MSRWALQPSSLSLRIIPDIRETERRSFDLTGFITTAVAMVSLVTAMERLGDRQPQIWPTLALAALGFGCLLYSIRHFRRAAAPWFVSTPCRCRRSG
jgi:hypothetical protein